MARQIKVQDAQELLEVTFALAEEAARENAEVTFSEDVILATDRLFSSVTQAYREALIGCAVARVIDPEIDIHLPATEDGDKAFSGRSLADNVITPFMRGRSVPVSVSPYLSSLRGGAKFVEGGEPRIQRDKEGFAALVSLVDFLANHDQEVARSYLIYLLRRFISLRDQNNIALKKIAKPSLEQFARLVEGLLSTKSGGRFPMLLAVATFQTLNECHSLGWEIEWQGINVADKASGAVGDITIKKDGEVVLGVEVTERPVDGGRVTWIFNQKVSPVGLDDYLFLTTVQPDPTALTVARSYTAVGHEMNFVILDTWIVNILSVLGGCRPVFQAKVLDLLNSKETPSELKVAWNNQMDLAIGIGL